MPEMNEYERLRKRIREDEWLEEFKILSTDERIGKDRQIRKDINSVTAQYVRMDALLSRQEISFDNFKLSSNRAIREALGIVDKLEEKKILHEKEETVSEPETNPQPKLAKESPVPTPQPQPNDNWKNAWMIVLGLLLAGSFLVNITLWGKRAYPVDEEPANQVKAELDSLQGLLIKYQADANWMTDSMKILRQKIESLAHRSDEEGVRDDGVGVVQQPVNVLPRWVTDSINKLNTTITTLRRTSSSSAVYNRVFSLNCDKIRDLKISYKNKTNGFKVSIEKYFIRFYVPDEFKNKELDFTLTFSNGSNYTFHTPVYGGNVVKLNSGIIDDIKARCN